MQPINAGFHQVFSDDWEDWCVSLGGDSRVGDMELISAIGIQSGLSCGAAELEIAGVDDAILVS